MRIALIYPFFLYTRVHGENVEPLPIGLYTLGACLLEQGHVVELFNWHTAELAQAGLPALEAFRPDMVGFSLFHANRWGGIELARVVREMLPQAFIVFGGVGATFLDEHLLRLVPELDVIVRGEGERTLVELAEAVERGELSALSVIPGLSRREQGRVVRNADRPLLARLDDLPHPARHFTFQHVSLSRGCVGKCSFCGSPRFWGSGIRFHSAEYFLDELELLYKRGVRFFYVSDDTFTVRRELTLAICRGIRERGLEMNWAAISRVDCVDAELLCAMRQAGCIQISYGVESGSASILSALNKPLRTEQVERAFALTTRHGILARAYVIYGSPGETDATIAETLDLLERIKPLVVLFHVLAVFPGTTLYESCRARLGWDDDIWLDRDEDILYYETDAALPEERVLESGRRLRQAWLERLPAYAGAIELEDRSELAGLHADFLSRLALTFHQGDYAHNEHIPRKRETAAQLYRRSLAYAPNSRAYLGLALLLENERNASAATELLHEGLRLFPQERQFQEALTRLRGR